MGERVSRERSGTNEQVDEKDWPSREAGRAAIKGAQKTAEKAGEEIDEIDQALEEAEERRLDQEALDKLFDEIDAILEPNAEEFVAGFRQRGGE